MPIQRMPFRCQVPDLPDEEEARMFATLKRAGGPPSAQVLQEASPELMDVDEVCSIDGDPAEGDEVRSLKNFSESLNLRGWLQPRPFRPRVSGPCLDSPSGPWALAWTQVLRSQD